MLKHFVVTPHLTQVTISDLRGFKNLVGLNPAVNEMLHCVMKLLPVKITQPACLARGNLMIKVVPIPN